MRRALLIGINYTGAIDSLFGCHTDVASMRSLLEPSYDSVETITDELASPTQPTRYEILTAMATAVSAAASGDLLFVHYSGCGTNLKNNVPGGDEAIRPADYEFSGTISDADLWSALVDNLAAGVKLRVLCDTRYSGATLAAPILIQNDGVTDPPAADYLILGGCAGTELVSGGITSGHLTAAFCGLATAQRSIVDTASLTDWEALSADIAAIYAGP